MKSHKEGRGILRGRVFQDCGQFERDFLDMKVADAGRTEDGRNPVLRAMSPQIYQLVYSVQVRKEVGARYPAGQGVCGYFQVDRVTAEPPDARGVTLKACQLFSAWDVRNFLQ